MSKPTILILSLIYVASILIVGIFGMQVMSFNNINYIESITINKDEIEFSNGQSPKFFNGEEITDDGIPYMQYSMLFNYEENLRISIRPIIVAKDPTLDPTNKELKVYSDKDTIVYENDVFTVKDRGTVIVIFNSQDASNKKMIIKLHAI